MARKYTDPLYCVRKNSRTATLIQELIDSGELSFCSDELNPCFGKWRLGPYTCDTAIAALQAMYGHGGKNLKTKSEKEAERVRNQKYVDAAWAQADAARALQEGGAASE